MKRKTGKEKRIQGTARKDREKKTKVVSISELPDPATWLHKEAHEIYFEICRHLKKVKALHMIDGHVVSMAANALYQYGKMAIVVNRPSRKGRAGGPIQVFKSGARQISPELSAMKEFAKQYAEFSKVLGLDPKSREALLAFTEEEDEEKDPMDELVNGKKIG